MLVHHHEPVSERWLLPSILDSSSKDHHKAFKDRTMRDEVTQVDMAVDAASVHKMLSR